MAGSIDYSRIADLYDTYVRTTVDIPFFQAEAETADSVLELMAGTGRVSLPLIKAGVRLTCVDHSPEMLAVLQAKLQAQGLTAVIKSMDVRQLDLNQAFDLILLPFQAFAELVTPTDQRQVLSAIAQHLAAGGRFICPLHNPHVRLKSADGKLRLWKQYPLQPEQGTLLFWGMETFDPESELLNGYEFFEVYDGRGVMRSKRMLETRFRLINKAEFEALATLLGFKVAALYGDYDYSPFQEGVSPFMIWVLSK
jgi:SAM-dependent methyltransferase